PEAFTPIPAQLHPDLTTRERVILQTTPESCAQCHDMINPLGFTLESYDAIGRYRDQENGQEIDTSGSYLARSGELVRFSNARELSEYLASSEEAHAALVERLFVHLVKQPVRAFGPTTLSQLQQVFAERQYSIRD